MPFFDSDGTRIFYSDVRPDVPAEGMLGVPTVLLHGWLCDSDDWIFQLPSIEARCRTIAVDLRGHGRSGWREGMPFSPADAARDVSRLLASLGVDQAVVIAHSAGCEVAVRLELLGPGRVVRSVAVDPAYGLPAEREAGYRVLIDELGRAGGDERAGRFFASIDAPATPPALAAWHARRPLGMDPRMCRTALEDFVFGVGTLRLRPGSDAALRERRAPVLSLHRTPERAAYDLAHSPAPGSRALVYDGCGHWPHQEQPRRFQRDLEDWLAEPVAPARSAETAR